MKLKINFCLSQKLRNEIFVAAGNRPKEAHSVDVDLEQATPAQRAALAAAWDLDQVGLGIDLSQYAGYTPTYSGGPPTMRLDAVPTPEAALELLLAQIPLKAEYEAAQKALAAEKKAASDAYYREQAQIKERNDEDARRRRDAEDAARLAAEDAKMRWVNEHGSAHLRRACARGHDCQRMYVLERARAEAPGYTVDFEDAAEWKGRACPSVAALDEAERVEALGLGLGEVEIVWLTSAAQEKRDDDGFYDDFQPGEAVVIGSYLGKYDLVRQM